MHKKNKYSTKLKLKLVKEVLSGKSSANGLSNQCKIPRTLLRKWVDQYQSSGTKGLLPRTHQNYQKEFKLRVIEIYHREKLTLRDCCLRFDISDQSILLSWLRKYEQKGQDGLRDGRGRPKFMKGDKPSKKKSNPQTRLEELEKENLYLRAEIDFLKKLEALTQKEKTPKRKKH